MDENEELKKQLIESIKQKEDADKMLLDMEIVIGILVVILFLGILAIASLIDIPDWIRLAIIIPSVIFFLIITFLMLVIEQKAGYYECRKCQYRYVPKYSSVLLAQHIGRTRYMKCPECNEKSWHRKVISKL